MDIVRTMLAQGVRFAAASQAAPALMLHGAWILLAVATWQAGDTSGEAAALMRPFMRAFAWLGGFGPDGRGDGGDVAQAMALLTLPVYLVAAIFHRGGRPRAPLLPRVVKWTVASGVVAFAGFALAIANAGSLHESGYLLVVTVFASITAGATAWAVLIDALGDLLVSRMQPSSGAGPAPSAL